MFAPIADVENIHAMEEREFENYLAKIRMLRPRFKQYVEAGEALYERGKQPRSLYQFAQTNQNTHRMFLSAQSHDQHNTPDSRSIQQQPHLNGGLTYSAPSRLQSMCTRTPMPGRYVNVVRERAIVSFAGMTTEYNAPTHVLPQTIDWKQLAITGERDPSRGVSKFRITDSQLMTAPRVVGGSPNMLRNVVMFSRVKDTEEPSFQVHNPHRPGSTQYILHEEGADSTKSPIYQPSRRYPTSARVSMIQVNDYNDTLLKTLGNLQGVVGSDAPDKAI